MAGLASYCSGEFNLSETNSSSGNESEADEYSLVYRGRRRYLALVTMPLAPGGGLLTRGNSPQGSATVFHRRSWAKCFRDLLQSDGRLLLSSWTATEI